MEESNTNFGNVKRDNAAAKPQPVIAAGWLRGLLFFVAFVVFTAVHSVAAAILMIGTNETDFMSLLDKPIMLLITAISVVGLFLIVWFFRAVVDRDSLSSLGFRFKRQDRIDLGAGLLWGVVLVVITFLILLAAGLIRVTGTGFNPLQLATTLSIMILAVIQEEIVMRGYLLSSFMDSMNKYTALVLVSLLFAVSHGFNPGVTWLALINILLAGLLLGVYYVHCRNLWFPIGLHLTWNFFQGPIMGSPVSGLNLDSVIALEISGNELLSGGDFGFESSLITSAVIIAAMIALHLKYRHRQA